MGYRVIHYITLCNILEYILPKRLPLRTGRYLVDGEIGAVEFVFGIEADADEGCYCINIDTKQHNIVWHTSNGRVKQ